MRARAFPAAFHLLVTLALVTGALLSSRAQETPGPLFPVQGIKLWLGGSPASFNEYLGQPLDTSSYYRWRDVLDRIRDTGANHVTLQLSTGVMERPTDNAYSTTDLNPSPQVLRALAADIKARGMSVGVSIFSNVANVITGSGGSDRPAPSDPVAWFANHRTRVLERARFAQEIGATSFIFVQDEVQDLVVHPQLQALWPELMDAIRAVFAGKLTTVFSTNGAGNYFIRLSPTFVAKLDYLGVGFFPVLSRAEDPSVETLVQAYSRSDLGLDVLGFLRELHVATGKKIWITDKAFHSYTGSAGNLGLVFNETIPLTPDEPLQARLYESFLQVMASQSGGWLHGVSFQSYNNLITGRVRTARFISSPVSESPQNKQAEAVLMEWFGGRRTKPLQNYLSNLSVRVAVRPDQMLIVGFSLTGGAKPMLLRASGPALTTFGLAGSPNPTLGLFRDGSLLLGNDDWRAPLAPFFNQVGAFSWTAGSRDAAVLPTLTGSYTAHAGGGGAGAILVEAYDAGANYGPQLSNLSARYHVGTGADVLIAGFAVGGTGQRRVLIRAIGPKLADFGVSGFLARPRLTVFQDGREIVTAAGWATDLAATFSQVGAFGLTPGSADAALVLSLEGGKSYTAQVSGVDQTTGEALIEVYALP